MKPINFKGWLEGVIPKKPIRNFRFLTITLFLFVCNLALAQVNTGGSATTSNHNKQIIGYITNWDAWKAASAGVPSAGALTQLNIDYSKYTILNFSFFGVAVDGSLHSGDLRNKQIYQEGQVQQPGDLLYGDVYSSWDFYILFGEIEPIQWINEEVKQRAEALGFQVEVGGNTWTHPEWGLSGVLPLPLPKEGSGGKGLLELAHDNGVKVMASIGGWSMCKHFPEMAADPVKRTRFIEDCKKLINMGFDGIDLDWEYPGPYAGMNFTGTNADFANFATLVQEIRNAIGPDKLITAAMSADPAKLDGFNWPQLVSTMDYFNMMTYDFNGGWSNIAGHNAPIYPYDGAEAPDFNWQSTFNKLMSLGVPSTKINMGIPFYGRGVVTDGDAALNAPTTKRNVTIQPDGPVSTAADYTNWPLDVYDGTPNYFFIKQKTGTGSGWTRQWDDQAKVPYMTKGNFFLSYDDEESIGLKAQYINDNNLGGTIVWTVFGDLEISGTAQSFGNKLKRWSNVKSPLVNKVNEIFATGGGNITPTVTITSPTNNTEYNAGDNVTIEANANDSDGTITKVEFYAGTTFLGEDSTAPYSYTWQDAPLGPYTLVAKVYDNEGASATSSVAIIVGDIDVENQLPQVSITTPQEGASFSTGEVITISANATDEDGTISKVEFYDGNVLLGEDTSSPYNYTWNNATAGTHTVRVVATDNRNGTGVDNVSVSVTGGNSCSVPAYVDGQVYTGGDRVSYQGNEYEAKWWTQNNDPVTNKENVWKLIGPCGDGQSAPEVTITSPVAGQSFVAGSVVIINANASDADGNITKVEFFVDGSKIGEDTTAPYLANWTSTVGNHTISVKATDDSNASTTSASIAITVNSDGGCDTSGFKVVGYMPSWQGDANAIQYDKLTHINYSFLLPNSDGSLRPLENASKMQQIVSLGHAQGVKVLIAVGGWMDGNDAPFTQLAANTSTRTAFVNNLVNFVNQYNLDGVDMDWEYPREGNEPQNFELLMQELGQALHSRGKLLTAAVVVSGWNADGVSNGVFDDVDFLNIMAYDGPEHSTMAQAEGGLNYWLGRGLPKEKAILGVPFYSRPQAQSYASLLAQGASPNSDSFQGNNYNGVPTIKAKTQMALDRAGGVMMWELSHDTTDPNTSLLAAINSVIGNPCTPDNSAPQVSVTSPQGGDSFEVGNSIAITASATDTDGTVNKVEFFVDGTMIAEDTSAPYTASWTAIAGNHTISAKAIDNEGASTTSTGITISVQADTGGSCNDPQYVENGGYVAGSVVQNNGNLYECKPHPFSGWCNGAAWAYAPGEGTYWEDAWTLVGECSGGNPPGNEVPTTTITQPGSGQTFTAGSTITINASATDSDGTITKVEFFSNGTKIGEDNSSPYSYTWNNVNTGNYSLTTIATDNDNATGTSSAVPISVGSTNPPNPGGDLPKRILVGYWHNFDNNSSIPKLRDISDKWDVINVSFAIPTVPNGATMTFTPDPAIYSSVQEFKNDVALLQSRGKKVLISMGGATGAVDVDSPADAQAFSSSMTSIINEYGFDGMDIDFEGSSVSLAAGDTDFMNPTSPKIVNLINACRAILGQYSSDFVLSMAPETLFVQGGFSGYGGPSGAYLPIIYALRNEMDYIHVQHYNTGCMLGLDGLCYGSGNADFQVAMADMLLQGFPVAGGQQFPALRQDQVAIGLPANPSAAGSGYTEPSEVHKALDYIIKGQSFGGRYTLRNPSGYPNFRGLMTWSINWDIVSGFGFSNPHRAYLDGLDTRASLVQTQSIEEVTLSPNPVNGDVINVSVKNKGLNPTLDLKIFNATGILVLQYKDAKLQKGSNLTTFDVSTLEEGLYFYTISTSKGNTTGKLIKR
ncbi:glycosyl hydrolase family 18 protein [Aquimarina sp. D1M17]|uniref:glycosyl hydrolase family 18 protein n=1 Tax=Aquimarina acroporae TaxID=2937283 RepID=UPI0020C13B48|nr:glycosyl hydrolase family 18 protein [Aquimarina acroporae]MCK8522950.1 glycosyl hydrolase family 18 protein [Aquimarina acroporae]